MSIKEPSKDKLISSRRLIKSREYYFKNDDYKNSVMDRIKAREIIGSDIKFKALLMESKLVNSKYNLIDDYKKKISAKKRLDIINKLGERSRLKYNLGNFKGCIRSLRRMEKYY